MTPTRLLWIHRTVTCIVLKQALSDITQTWNYEAGRFKTVWCLIWLQLHRFYCCSIMEKNPKFSSQFLHPWGTPVKKTKDKNCIFIKKEILFLTHCMYPQARVWWYCLCACFFGHFEPSHSALHHWETKVRWSSLNSRWQQQCLMFPCKVVLQRLPGRMCSLFKTQHLQCPEGS